MRVSTPDITKILVLELEQLLDKYKKYQTRVKTADEAARARDEESRKQNATLTERILGLEIELNQARDSIEVWITDCPVVTMKLSSHRRLFAGLWASCRL